MADIQKPRDTWFLKNVTKHILTITDLPKIPSFKPGERTDVLKYADVQSLKFSVSFNNYANKQWLISEDYLHTHDDKSDTTHTIEDHVDTDATGSQLNTLVGGSTSNADSLHTHDLESIIDHNDLRGIQGGEENQYYHLKQNDHSILTSGSTSIADSLHIHSSSTITHNDLSSLQGGNYENGEFYHFNLANYNNLKDITATFTEINQSLDGISDDVTFTNLNILTAGSTSDADALHTHASSTITHNSLYGLQGGAASQYYHLALSNYTNLIGITATFTEINQALDGIGSAVTFTNLNTLTNGSNADLLHVHSMGGLIDHNELRNLQGGNASNDEFYHFDLEDFIKVSTNTFPHFLVEGNTQLGNEAEGDTIGINTAPVASQLITASITESDTIDSYFIRGIYNVSGDDAYTAKGYYLDLDSSGTHDVADGKVVHGVSIDLDDTTVLNNSDAILLLYGGDFNANFGGTVTDALIVRMYGLGSTVGGNLGTDGIREHTGLLANVTGTATTNYGIELNVSGATTSYGLRITTCTAVSNAYGIWDGSGADWVLDADDQKITLGEGQEYDIEYTAGSVATHTLSSGSFLFTGGDTYIGEGNDLRIGDNTDPTTSRILFGDGANVVIEESAVDVMKLTGNAGIIMTTNGSSPITFIGVEDLVLTSSDNTWTWSSSTGVTDINFSAFNLTTTGNIFLGSNSSYLYFGTHNDAYIYFDGTDLQIGSNNPSRTGDIVFNDDIIPIDNNTIDLGSDEKRFRDLYLSGESIYLGSSRFQEKGDDLLLQTVGDIFITNDSKKLYFGEAQDAYIEFDGNSLNIKANEITETDTIVIEADNFNLDRYGNVDLKESLYFGDNREIRLHYDGTDFRIDSTNPSIPGNIVLDDDVIMNHNLNVLGNTQLGDVNTDYHGINIAPVATVGMILEFYDTAAATIIYGYQTDVTKATGDQWSNVTGVVGHEYDVVSSGTLLGGSAVRTVSGVVVDVDSNEVLNSGGALLTATGFSAHVAFGGTNTNSDVIYLYGSSLLVAGDIGTTGITAHYGQYISVSGTADNNYGINIATVSGATNNYGIYDNSGADWVLDADDQKIWFGEGQEAFIEYDASSRFNLDCEDTLNLQPNAQSNVRVFNDTDVANGSDGKRFYVWRRATEGDSHWAMYADQYKRPSMYGSGGDMLIWNESSGYFYIYCNNGDVALQSGANGDVTMFQSAASGENPSFRQAGYITNGANEVEIMWTVKDTDDYFWLERENTNLLGFKVGMQMEIETTVGGFVVPRMTTAQRNALTAINGMIIYNNDTPAFNYYENGAWVTGSGLT